MRGKAQGNSPAWVAPTCLAQHVYVNPCWYKVGQPSSHDHDALPLEQTLGIGRGLLLESGQLGLCTPDSCPATDTDRVNTQMFLSTAQTKGNKG